MSNDEIEYQWHRAVATELEDDVESRDFFLWITVEPPGQARADGVSDILWRALATNVNHWLTDLDPDGVTEETIPERQFDLAYEEDHNVVTVVTLKAIPKKAEARGKDPLVGNPYPPIAFWSQ